MPTAFSLHTLRDHNLEAFSLVWLHTSIDDIQTNIDDQERLRASINHLKIFQDDQECEHYIRSMSTDDRVVLIVADQLGQKLIPRIHELRQLLLIYIYSMDEKADQQWANQFTKVNNTCLSHHSVLTEI
jgi:hypothetical protein